MRIFITATGFTELKPHPSMMEYMLTEEGVADYWSITLGERMDDVDVGCFDIHITKKKKSS